MSFPNSGPDATPGLIVMQIDDLVGEDVDPELDGALVVFNASPEAITEQVDGLAGREFALTDAQANGSDAVVKTTEWDAATGTVTVPARSARCSSTTQEPAGVATSVTAVPSKVFAKAGSAGEGRAVTWSPPTAPTRSARVTILDGGERHRHDPGGRGRRRAGST